MGPVGSSKYYSWTSLITTGTIVDHGVTMKVSGISWMDHQWGAMALLSGAGWDWFSVQLYNGEQFMVYLVRNSKGAVVDRFATEVSRSGKVTYIRDGIHEHVLATWHSPASGVTYGSGWQLTLSGGHLDISPYLRDQELDLRGSPQHNAYWEGDVGVSGVLAGRAVAGVGYTEINPPGQSL